MHHEDPSASLAIRATALRGATSLILALLAPTLAGCGTVVTHRKRREIVHWVRVESPGARATVDVDNELALGATPARARLRMIVVEEERLDRTRRSWGYAGLIATPVLIAGGILLGATANGLGNVFRPEDEQTDFSAPYLIGAGVAAALSFGLGIYALSTATTSKERVISPAQEIGLRSAAWRGRHALRLRSEDGRPRLGQVQRLVFEAKRRRWRLLGRSEGLTMRARHELGSQPPTRTAKAPPASRPAPAASRASSDAPRSNTGIPGVVFR